jgi:hypothetical protein
VLDAEAFRRPPDTAAPSTRNLRSAGSMAFEKLLMVALIFGPIFAPRTDLLRTLCILS